MLIATLVAACGGGLELRHIKSDQKRPNNVWVFFTAERGDEPVGDLDASNFEIYEDGGLVSGYESKQVILNPEVAAVMYTLLLLDMSGSVTESGQAGALVDAAEKFAERVGKSQRVAVYAFDGSPRIHSVVPFTEARGNIEGGLEGLRKYKPRDPSTNLNGAVVEGLRTLKRELDRDRRPLKFGTLVVFTDGTDRAARVTRSEVLDEMSKPEYETYEVFAIGVGAELDRSQLEDVGRDGTELATNPRNVEAAFDRMAARIEGHRKRFYLLSYCTPSRNGDHRVEIRARTKDGTGSLEYGFSANGFGPPPDCDPQRKPAFSLQAQAERDAISEREAHEEPEQKPEQKPEKAEPAPKPQSPAQKPLEYTP